MADPFPNRAPETLHATDSFSARRSGRFLLVTLLAPHRVISTSTHRGGEREDLQYLVNHQSCEANADTSRLAHISEIGLVEYHREVCNELGIAPDRTALMGTAANMAYAAHRWVEFGNLRADAIVTGGVAGNSARAGDPAQWVETDGGWERVSPYAGTINIMLLLNRPVTSSALARAVVTMTEAKSAALAELAVPSRYSATIATGTGTDQFCVAAPLDPTRKPRDATGPHVKLGEIIGVCVRDAIKETLRWQNGLEPSYTRGLAHALGRFGLTKQRALEALEQLLPKDLYDQLEANHRAVFFDPGVGAAAYALAAVLDRVAFGTIPEGLAWETLRQQATCLACALASRPQDWVMIYSQLAGQHPDDPVDLVLRAIALGWRAKWT